MFKVLQVKIQEKGSCRFRNDYLVKIMILNKKEKKKVKSVQDKQKLLITIVKLVKKLHCLFFENNFFFHSFSWVTFKWVSFFSVFFFSMSRSN